MKIVLGTDGSECAAEAAGFLTALPLPTGISIEVVSVVDPYLESLLVPIQAGQRERAHQVANEAAEALRRTAAEVTVTVRRGSPAHELIVAAEEADADLLVVGSRGLTGVEAFVLGSTARNVARHAACSVLVGRDAVGGLRRVVLATDGSEHGELAVDFTSELPLPPETQVVLLHVVRKEHPIGGLAAMDPEHLHEALRAGERLHAMEARKMLRTSADILEESGQRVEVEVRVGDPATEILACAREQKADLIVAGARGHSPIHNLVFGSVADRLLKRAECSVLLVR